MRLKWKIQEYVEGKEKVSLRNLLYWLENEGKDVTVRKVSSNLSYLGWKQESRNNDIYKRIDNYLYNE